MKPTSMVKIEVKVLIIFSALLLAQNDTEKDGVDKFLENIHQVLKKIVRFNDSKSRRAKAKNSKTIIRKKIIEKLSTPFFRQPQHSIIEYNKKEKIDNIRTEVERNKIPDLQVSKSLERILRNNPVLTPFKFPNPEKIKKILADINNKIANNNTTDKNQYATPSSTTVNDKYVYSLREWYLDMSKNAIDFWSFFKRFFIDNDQRFSYLKNVLCHSELSGMRGKGLKGKDIFSEMFSTNTLQHLNLETVWKIFSPLVCEDYKWYDDYSDECKLYRYIRLSQELPSDIFQKSFFSHSLCFTITTLNVFGYKEIHSKTKNLESIFNCIKNYRGDNAKVCENIENKVTVLIPALKKYFKIAQNIYKKQILSTIYQMCYKECLCDDLGIKCLTIPQQSAQANEQNLLYLLFIMGKDSIRKWLEKLERFLGAIDITKVGNLVDSYQGMNEIYSCSETFKNLSNLISSVYLRVKNDGIHYGEVVSLKKWLETEEPATSFAELKNFLQKVQILHNKAREIFEDSIIRKFSSIFLEFNKDDNPVCSFIAYSLLFDKIGIDNILNMNFATLFEQVQDVKKRTLLYGFYTGKLLSSEETGIYYSRNFPVEKIKADTIKEAIGFFNNIFYTNITTPKITLPALLFYDYYVYFYYLEYTLEKCITKDPPDYSFKTFLENKFSTVGWGNKKRKFFECIFKNSPFIKCFNEFYEDKNNVKNIIEHLLAFADIHSLEIGRWEDIISKVNEQIESKSLREIIPGLDKCCRAIKNLSVEELKVCKDINCTPFVNLDIAVFKEFCPNENGGISSCPPAGCFLCVGGEITSRLICDWDACNGNQQKYTQCDGIAGLLSFLIEQNIIIDWDKAFCRKVIEFKKCCDNFSSECVDLENMLQEECPTKCVENFRNRCFNQCNDECKVKQCSSSVFGCTTDECITRCNENCKTTCQNNCEKDWSGQCFLECSQKNCSDNFKLGSPLYYRHIIEQLISKKIGEKLHTLLKEQIKIAQFNLESPPCR